MSQELPEGTVTVLFTDVEASTDLTIRLGTAQTFDRWFAGRPEVSTIVALEPYDQLFVLASEAATWSQQFSGASQGSAVLAGPTSAT